MPAKIGELAATLHRNELWVLRSEKLKAKWRSDLHELIGFLPGQDQPVVIPLSFALAAADIALIPSTHRPGDGGGYVELRGNQHEFVSCNHGLIFSGPNCHGAWVLPWTVIYAWIEAHNSSDQTSR